LKALESAIYKEKAEKEENESKIVGFSQNIKVRDKSEWLILL